MPFLVDDTHLTELNTTLTVDSLIVRRKGKVTELPVAKLTLSKH